MRRRVTSLLAAAILVGAIAAAALWPEASPVEVAPVTRGPMMVTIDGDGIARVRQRFVVSAPVTGRLQRIDLRVGDRVRRGETVLRLVPSAPPLLDTRTRAELSAAIDAARAAQGQLRAERDRASAAAERARSSVRRLASLAAAGAIAPDELDTAETSLKSAEGADLAAQFAVARADHEYELARARLRPSTPGGGAIAVPAPVDGVVLRRFRESETVVPAGEPLLEIGDPRQLEVVFDLLSTDAVRLGAGCRAFIEDWGGPGRIAGHIRQIEPAAFMKVSALGIEEQRVNAVVDFAEGQAAEHSLGVGYRVEVRAGAWASARALQVPVGSLLRHGAGWGVLVVEGGRARMRAVQIGQRNAEDAEVLGGVVAGDTVILHPADTLADGSRVTPVRR
jgi:HlyD family secretion protein